jgi:hypothetical protein
LFFERDNHTAITGPVILSFGIGILGELPPLTDWRFEGNHGDFWKAANVCSGDEKQEREQRDELTSIEIF